VASKSKDPGACVGAVIVDRDRRVVSTGYNGFPRGIPERYDDKEEKLRKTIHAEVNAILFARRDIFGMTLYVTHHPCGPCAAVIVQSGVSRVVCYQGDLSERWVDHMRSARELFRDAGIEFDIVGEK